MRLSKYGKLANLVEDLLNRFGITACSLIDPEVSTPQTLADRLAGIEVYSLQTSGMIYVIMPEEVQELLLLMASAIYTDEDDDSYFLDNGEE